MDGVFARAHLFSSAPGERLSPWLWPGPGAAAGPRRDPARSAARSTAAPGRTLLARPRGSGCRRAAQAVCVHHFFQVTLGFAGYHKRPSL